MLETTVTTKENHFRFAVAMEENGYIGPRLLKSIEKPREKSREPARNTASGLLLPRWRTVGLNYSWASRRQSDSIEKIRRKHR